MNPCVLIPLRTTDLRSDYWHPGVAYFDSRGIDVFLLLNGRSICEPSHVADKYEHVKFFFTGQGENPYKARNVGLSHVFDDLGYDYAILLDADCTPIPGYMASLKYLLEPLDGKTNFLIAGQTCTAIPTTDTRHFNLLRGTGFECYHGHTPEDHTVGANMVIGHECFQKLGPMDESKVSGGDGKYGIAWKKEGNRVIVGSDGLRVFKTIHGMHLRGILEKQLRRACSYPPEMVPSYPSVVSDLKKNLLEMQRTIGDKEITDYNAFIDQCFKLMMRFGLLSQHLDKVNIHDSYNRTNTEQL